MTGSNSETLASYQDRVQQYVDGTAQEVFGAAKAWIDRALDGLATDARILELGSAFGRDAAYMAAKGFTVECSDAVPGFVALLREKGFAARRLNLLTDAVDGPYDLILANAVLLHFTRAEFAAVLTKLAAALNPGGRLAFSLKKGLGEAWSDAKIGAPRYFCYWDCETLEPALSEAGLAHWDLREEMTERAHGEWLFLIARAP